MSAAWAQVRDWRSSDLEGAAQNLRDVEDRLIDTGDGLNKVAPPSWSGTASDGARAQLDQLKELLEDRIAEVAAVRRGLLDASDGVVDVERAVKRAEQFAADNGLEITATNVQDVRGLTMCYATEHDEELARDARSLLVDECAAYVAEAVRRAGDVDQDLSQVLNGQVMSGALAQYDYRSPDDAALRGENAGVADLYGQPAKDATPAQNKAWWDSLTEAEKTEILKDHPDWINNRNGLPADVLDAASTALLPVYQEQVKDQLWSLRNELAGLGPDDKDRKKALEKAIGELEDKRDSLDTVDRLGRQDSTMILGLDISNQRAQAIISNGNPDTADQVGVFTPGLTSTVQDMDGYAEDMRKMRLGAERSLNRDPATAGEDVAMVTWLGYQAPQISAESLTDFDGDSVAMANSARTGGDRLAEFYQGINVKNDHADITALGHSYGSTTTGYALQHANTGVDRVAFFGSPGLGVNDVNDLKVPSGKVFYEEANWDGVGDLQRFGKDPSEMDGVVQLDTNEVQDAQEGKLSGITLHTSYLNEGTTSQHNLQSLVAGQEDRVVEGDHNVPLGEILRDSATNPLGPGGEIGERLGEKIGEELVEVRDSAVDLAETGAEKVAEGFADVAAGATEKGYEVRQGVGSIYEQLKRAAMGDPGGLR
ncbi:alpha/beta hydrolase [Kineosporia mesophila]|uniref:alpha/beta hydrolase n=1 Tax=Kineosporia mesophila TaxID=566012 RepID=UPI001E38B9EA|nr:alpha/beta hydrolase family protein [Kineosporia mesophila]